MKLPKSRLPVLPFCLLVSLAASPSHATSRADCLGGARGGEARGGDGGDRAPPAGTVPQAAEPAGPKPDINGNHVMQYVKEIVAIGSRPVGSPGHAKLEQYILSKLKGVDVEQDKFTAQTPVGKFPINNIIAKFPGRKDGIIVVAGHYDTNYPLPKAYVGANDGGSSTALLLALADQFRGKELRRLQRVAGVDRRGRGLREVERHRQSLRHAGIWRRSGSRMAPRRRSRRSSWWT